MVSREMRPASAGLGSDHVEVCDELAFEEGLEVGTPAALGSVSLLFIVWGEATYRDDGGAERHYFYHLSRADLATKGEEPEGEGRESDHCRCNVNVRRCEGEK